MAIDPPKSVRTQFRHGDVRPTAHGPGMDESWIKVFGREVQTIRGSIYPDIMNNYGRIKDGRYNVQIGFRKRGGQPIPTESDLDVRTDGFRAALIVEGDRPQPILSDDSGLRTSGNLHIHNGYIGNRGSNGCLTVPPSDWLEFMTTFLAMYPNLNDWYVGTKASVTSYCGLNVGTLEVSA